MSVLCESRNNMRAKETHRRRTRFFTLQTHSHKILYIPDLCWSGLAYTLCLVKYHIKSPQRKRKNAKCEQTGRDNVFSSLLRIRRARNYLWFALTWMTIYFNNIWRKKHVWSSAIFSPDMAGKSGLISSGYIFAAEWKIMRAFTKVKF